MSPVIYSNVLPSENKLHGYMQRVICLITENNINVNDVAHILYESIKSCNENLISDQNDIYEYIKNRIIQELG